MPGDLPPQYGPVFQDTSRQMKLADLLRQQSLEMPQGQMVSGIYVPPAITQYMAQALKGYNANKMEADAQSKQKAAYDDFQTKRTNATQALIDGLKTKTVDQPVDYSDAGGMPGMTEQVLQQPDFNAAFTNYLNSGVADPAMVAYVTGERNYQRGREDKLEDRGYTERLEDKRYTRNRNDALQDQESNREFQRIMLKDQQGFQLTMQEKQFAQQHLMQKQGQDFQRGERVAGQNFQAGENAKARAAAPQGNQKPPTEFQAKAGLYFGSMQQASQTLNKLEDSGADIAPSTMEMVAPGQTGANIARGADRRSYVQAQRQWIDSINRVRSGANLPEIEYDRAVMTFFPQYNDDAETIKQKRLARENEEALMAQAAGPALPQQPQGSKRVNIMDKNEPMPEVKPKKVKFGDLP